MKPITEVGMAKLRPPWLQYSWIDVDEMRVYNYVVGMTTYKSIYVLFRFVSRHFFYFIYLLALNMGGVVCCLQPLKKMYWRHRESVTPQSDDIVWRHQVSWHFVFPSMSPLDMRGWEISGKLTDEGGYKVKVSAVNGWNIRLYRVWVYKLKQRRE